MAQMKDQAPSAIVNSMFSQKIRPGEELTSLQLALSQIGLQPELLKDITILPSKMGQFLKTQLDVATKQIERTMAATLEEIAANFLIDQFGEPVAPGALPVWLILKNKLEAASQHRQQQDFASIIFELRSFILTQILIMRDEQVQQLKEERTEYLQAQKTVQEAATGSKHHKIKKYAQRALDRFRAKIIDINQKIDSLTLSQDAWFGFVHKLTDNTKAVQVQPVLKRAAVV